MTNFAYMYNTIIIKISSSTVAYGSLQAILLHCVPKDLCYTETLSELELQPEP